MFDFDGRANLGYYETVAYVGVVALVLAGVGIWMGRHREGVIPFTCVAVLTLALTFVAPVDRVVSKVTGAITLHRAVLVLAFALAMLSGFGLDLLVRRWRDRARSLPRWSRIRWSRALALGDMGHGTGRLESRPIGAAAEKFRVAHRGDPGWDRRSGVPHVPQTTAPERHDGPRRHLCRRCSVGLRDGLSIRCWRTDVVFGLRHSRERSRCRSAQSSGGNVPRRIRWGWLRFGGVCIPGDCPELQRRVSGRRTGDL